MQGTAVGTEARVSFTDEVEQLIRRWEAAIGCADMAAILEAHCADIRMFDVPEPLDGVNGHWTSDPAGVVLLVRSE